MRISNSTRPRALHASRIADQEGVNTSARGRGSANKTRAQNCANEEGDLTGGKESSVPVTATKTTNSQTTKPKSHQPSASTTKLKPLRNLVTKHFTELCDDKINNSPISKATYIDLEKLVTEGMPLDPSLRFLGLEDGEQDEKWLRFQGMFGPQVRHLKRLSAGAELDDLRRIRAGERGWQSLGWYLERLKTERYGQRSKTGKMASPGTAIGAILATAKSGKK